jgi:hypothetical protein
MYPKCRVQRKNEKKKKPSGMINQDIGARVR